MSIGKQDDSSHKDKPPEYETGSQRDSESKRIPLERVVVEVLRRGLGVGRDTLKQTDETLRSVSDSAFTKEAASHVISQLGDIRQGMSKIVAKEIERYLGRLDLASELRKALHGMTIEGNIKIKFNDLDQTDHGEPKK